MSTDSKYNARKFQMIFNKNTVCSSCICRRKCAGVLLVMFLSGEGQTLTLRWKWKSKNDTFSARPVPKLLISNDRDKTCFRKIIMQQEAVSEN